MSCMRRMVMRMSKPVWMETWGHDVGNTIWSADTGRHLAQFDGCGPSLDTVEKRQADLATRDERAKLAAASPAMVRALLRVEWETHGCLCPDCLGNELSTGPYAGHKSDCCLDQALTAAGFPTRDSREEARRVMVEAET